MVSPEQQVSYLCFSYDPAAPGELGTSFTDDLLTGFTGRREVFYTLQRLALRIPTFANHFPAKYSAPACRGKPSPAARGL